MRFLIKLAQTPPRSDWKQGRKDPNELFFKILDSDQLNHRERGGASSSMASSLSFNQQTLL